MIIWLLTGLWVLLGCAEAAHLITILTDRSLQTYILLWGVLSLAGLFVCSAVMLILWRKYKTECGIGKNLHSPWMILFGILFVITLCRIWGGYVPDLQDAVYDIVIGNLETGSVMTVHPFLGTVTEASVPMRFQILGLSSLYTALITISQQSQYMIMCKIVPLCLWCFSMLLYWAFSRELFGENQHKRWLFVSLIAFLYLITDGREGLVGYRLFFAGFSGESIRAVLLIPYTFLVCWKRNWMFALIAVLAEACLVWTTYGVGYCFCILVCMFAVHFLSDRRAKHAA